jgi:ectoine hydroxylase-related dioxygenase (phytanoyl-CoA dioxygenase family)
MTITSDVARVTEEQRARFWEDGVVHLPQLLAPEWIELIGLGLRRNKANPGPYAQRLYEGTDREIYLDYCNHPAVPEFQVLVRDSPIVDVVAAILGSTELWLFFEQIWLKKPGPERRTPWHQDATYWMTGGDLVCGFWITIDPVPLEGSLEFVRGSHRGPLYAGTALDQSPDDDTAPYYEGLPRLPDIQADRAAWDIVSFANEPGDVVMFHPAALHGGGASTGGRRTLSLRFFGDGVTYDPPPPPGRASPPFPGVGATHRPGDLLRSSWFPQVLPRPDAQR